MLEEKNIMYTPCDDILHKAVHLSTVRRTVTFSDISMAITTLFVALSALIIDINTPIRGSVLLISLMICLTLTSIMLSNTLIFDSLSFLIFF